MAGIKQALRSKSNQERTWRPSSLSAEERLDRLLAEIRQLRAELRFEAALLEIQRLAGKLSGEP